MPTSCKTEAEPTADAKGTCTSFAPPPHKRPNATSRISVRLCSDLWHHRPAAATYHQGHRDRVEAALSTAVNALYSAMPKDPIAFLSNHFVGTAAAHRVEKPAPAPAPVQHETHVAARGQDNPQYPERQPVPDSLVAWGEPFPDYSPETWTHADVLANDRELSTGNQWADPPDVSRAGLASRISYAGDGQSKPLPLDATGMPRNPVGRTGLDGRGLLGKWGPNQAADPIVTRDCPTTGRLQVVAIQRKDTGTWALPGGMVDDGEAVSVAVRREFQEEAGNIADPKMRAKFDEQVGSPPATAAARLLAPHLPTFLSHLPPSSPTYTAQLAYGAALRHAHGLLVP
jgi:ADP-ribose pyrophosphatase